MQLRGGEVWNTHEDQPAKPAMGGCAFSHRAGLQGGRHVGVGAQKAAACACAGAFVRYTNRCSPAFDQHRPHVGLNRPPVGRHWHRCCRAEVGRFPAKLAKVGRRMSSVCRTRQHEVRLQANWLYRTRLKLGRMGSKSGEILPNRKYSDVTRKKTPRFFLEWLTCIRSQRRPKVGQV